MDEFLRYTESGMIGFNNEPGEAVRLHWNFP